MSSIPRLSTPNGSTVAPVADPSTHPELDVTKLLALPSEQQDLYLLTFVSTLTKHVQSLVADDCTAQQFYLKKELLQILNLASPPPTRVIRNNLGRCFAHIFENGDRKLLFETINDLVGVISSGKGKADGELRVKHAAVQCLGDVFSTAGDSAIGLHPLACSSLLKLLKNAPNYAGLRAGVFRALAKIVKMIGGSCEENTTRDIWKQARNYATSDKANLVQISACRCLESLNKNTFYFDNSSDFEHVKTTVWKAIDSSTPAVRHAAASTLAAALIKHHNENPVVEEDVPKGFKKPKRTNTKRQSMIGGAADDDDIPSRPETPVQKKSQVITFTLPEMLRQLSMQYVRSSTTNKARAGIAVCYTKILKGLGERTVESQYIKIADHLMLEILSNPQITVNRYRLLSTRKFVKTILEDVIGDQILGENGQLDAAKALINDVLKNYPQVIKERLEPTKHALIAALNALSSLIKTLGSAANGFAEACRDGLLQVLQHPSYTVQIFTSNCLRTFVLACPQQLLPCLTICMNSVNRELNVLATGRNSPRRCVGYANGLAAMLSTSSLQPLYGSVDVNSRVLSLATGLLKSSSKSELRISGTQIQVAWILIGGLMSLGPNFVKIHLSQLLLLWKNALPKPLAKDNTSQRSYLESSFLTHVRECALGSILSFLQFNSRLLTADVSKRIAAMLQNTSAFLKGLPSKKTIDDISQRLQPSLQLHDLDLMVQRRVLQCYTDLVNLSPAGGSEALLQSNLLTLAVSFFADPENYTPSSLSTSIASSAGSFETIWDVSDNCGFGVTGLVSGFNIKPLAGEHENRENDDCMRQRSPEATIDSVLTTPITQSLEYDSVALYLNKADIASLPNPPATEVVNTAIQLFAISLPLAPPKIQESILEQVATFLSSGSLQRDPGRKAAMTVNVAIALLSVLKVAVKETQSPAGDLTNPAVEKLIQDMLREFVIHPDQYVRSIGYEALGRMCNNSGNTYTNQEIKFLIDTIVNNREPNARAGCAVALGCIHSQVGGMAAGLHLKTILGVLMTLCNDPHPTVHFWALEGLSRVTDSAGLTFSAYVASTLGMLGQLYVSDTHNDEVASIINSNLELELPTGAIITRCVDSLINVLGPDLQDMSKARDLIMTLVGQFREEESAIILGQSLRCLEHLSLYAPGHLNFADYVVLLQNDLQSSFADLQDIAIDGLYNLMKRNSEDVVKVAEPGFEDQLWLALDAKPSHDGIRNVILNWLQQSCMSDTALWITRCQKVLSMTRTKVEEVPSVAAKTHAVPDLQDEEVAGFAAAAGEAKDEAASSGSLGQEPLRWQVRTFAISCIGEIFTMVTRDTSSDEISPAEIALQHKVADIIRMAFSASTSNVVEMRVWGLKIIEMVLKTFGKTPDPDFAEAPLLEQYQAQISSALTPAFAADSSPELASEAVNVCAAFIATGIVTDVDRMGRILKTLVTALENFSQDAEMASIGDLKGLSSNAQVMVKMAVFSAWAELQVASTEQKYLVDVMKPHIAVLTPLWLASLREFARLRFEPDISMSLGPPSLSGSLDSIYSALNRETLLKFYQDSWLNLVDAIASLIEQDSEFVFDALDGKDADEPNSNGNAKGNEINYRDEPVAFFFVLFGLAFEALVARPNNEALATREQTLEILLALKKILHPNVSGHAIYREEIFTETMDLLDRLVLTEGLDIQNVIVQIARAMCIAHPSALKGGETDNGDLSDDIEQLFELTRIMVLVLAGLLPNLTEAKQPARHQLTDEAVSLIRVALNALVDAAEVFPAIIKTDLHACIIHIFATILGTASCQAIVVPQSLSILKRFITSVSSSSNTTSMQQSVNSNQMQECLKRFLAIYLNAQKRETKASLPCVKNTLLASTVLLTSGTNSTSTQHHIMVRFLDEIVDCLSDRMTAKVAASCVRTLLMQMPKTPADESIARYLLPRLLSFVTNTETDDPEGARTLIAHALSSFVSTFSGKQVGVAMALIIPTLLSRASSEGKDVYGETSTRLLELAGIDQTTFRAVVAGMSEAQKAFVEEVIKSGRTAGPRPDVSDEDRKPTIALTMNFGGS